MIIRQIFPGHDDLFVPNIIRAEYLFLILFSFFLLLFFNLLDFALGATIRVHRNDVCPGKIALFLTREAMRSFSLGSATSTRSCHLGSFSLNLTLEFGPKNATRSHHDPIPICGLLDL